MFRRATSVRTFPDGPHEWSGGTETYHWLEVEPDSWIGTNRLCESEDEAIEVKNTSGHGEQQEYKADKDGHKYRTMEMTATLGWIRLTADQGTVEVFDPPPSELRAAIASRLAQGARERKGL